MEKPAEKKQECNPQPDPKSPLTKAPVISYNLVRDRERRQVKAPQRYGYADVIAYVLNVEIDIQDTGPINYKEAVFGADKDDWKVAMIEEIDSLMKNNTRDLVEKLANKRIVGCRWIFKRKPEVPEVELSEYKARLIEKGFTQ